ncbi:MAG TPA: HAMP domain-containing sensor histidine kinase [Candidatus Ozemobacteraceae bacterium]|nr:HAMP domain-containing sensor histidine kinase [Candidatus Ozemobacteraceae bacterium]
MSHPGVRSLWGGLIAIIVIIHLLAGLHTGLLLQRSAASRAELLTDALLESAEQTLQASHYLEERVSAKLRSIAYDIASAPGRPDPEQLANLVRRNEIRSITLYDSSGSLLLSSPPGDAAESLPESYGCHEVLHGAKTEHVFGFSEGMFCEADAFGVALRMPDGGLVRVIADVAFVLGFERNVGLPALIERFRQHPDIRRLELVDMQDKPILSPASAPAGTKGIPTLSRPIVLHGKPVGRFLLELDDPGLSALRKAALSAIAVSCILSVGLLLLLRRREFRNAELLEQKRLLEETERRSEGLARIVSGVAHEIRNPLNTLALGLDSLQSAVSELPAGVSSEAGKRLEMLRQTVREANSLVHGLLQTTRPILPKIQRFSLAPWLDEVKLAYATSFPQTSLVSEAPPGLAVESDPELLRRLVWNLISNAAQAGANHVRLSIVTEGRHSILRVTDDGPGLPQQILDHLFLAGNTARPDGTGLGLYNAHRMACALGGSLRLIASGTEGTVFELRLPSNPDSTGGPHGDPS